MNKYRSHNCAELTESDSVNSEQLCDLYLFIYLILFLLD